MRTENKNLNFVDNARAQNFVLHNIVLPKSYFDKIDIHLSLLFFSDQ